MMETTVKLWYSYTTEGATRELGTCPLCFPGCRLWGTPYTTFGHSFRHCYEYV